MLLFFTLQDAFHFFIVFAFLLPKLTKQKDKRSDEPKVP